LKNSLLPARQPGRQFGKRKIVGIETMQQNSTDAGSQSTGSLPAPLANINAKVLDDDTLKKQIDTH
jgi:hypothetical protein